MFPLWLVYLLIALILILDTLLVIEVILVSLFLVAFIAFNIATAIIGKRIDRYTRERLDRMKSDLEAKPGWEGAGTATGHLKTVYRIAFTPYKIYDITLLWLLNGYVP
jgi:hypothetical protein